MKSKWILAIAAVGCVALASAPAQGATTSQVRAKCSAAWSGSKTTAAFRSYRTKCTAAAKAAISDATDAGNPTSTAANRTRAQRACNIKFSKPRNTAAKRKAYNACVSAAMNAQRAYGLKALRATLLGSNEVGGAGAATGTASVRVNVAAKRVCVTLTLDNFGAAGASAAHIHKGAAGVDGGVVVAIYTPQLLSDLDHHRPGRMCDNGGASTAVLRDIRAHPGNYYVNIHNTQFPNGAARGQLHT